jgi:hypothetical protein
MAIDKTAWYHGSVTRGLLPGQYIEPPSVTGIYRRIHPSCGTCADCLLRIAAGLTDEKRRNSVYVSNIKALAQLYAHGVATYKVQPIGLLECDPVFPELQSLCPRAVVLEDVSDHQQDWATDLVPELAELRASVAYAEQVVRLDREHREILLAKKREALEDIKRQRAALAAEIRGRR